MSSSRRIPRFIVLFSSSHCLLSSWRRFHVFESSHPSFHRTVVFVESVPCLRVVASLVSSYCFLRVIVCCLRGVGSMSSSRRIPCFIVPYSSGHRCVVAASFLCLRVVGSSFRRLRYIILESGIKDEAQGQGQEGVINLGLGARGDRLLANEISMCLAIVTSVQADPGRFEVR